ncbi:MAG TPA: hypothetical protein VGI56_10665 [Galbitalea sp.]
MTHGPDPAPLPGELPQQFRVSDANGAGLPEHRLRAADLDRQFWGLRSTKVAEDLVSRSQLLQLRMPEHAFFSHVTAAQLYGIPVPLGYQSSSILHVSVPAPARAPHAAGLQGHAITIEPADATKLLGIRVSSVARTWCDLSTQLSLHNLVAAGDYIIRRDAPLASRATLRAAVNGFQGRRGLPLLVAALELLHDRAESAPESILRVMLRQAGFPDPRVNYVVTDRFGAFLARTDLFIEEYKLVLEYQGDYHRKSREQFRSDMTRRSKLEAEGLRFMEINGDDLHDPAEVMQRIRKLVGLV